MIIGSDIDVITATAEQSFFLLVFLAW